MFSGPDFTVIKTDQHNFEWIDSEDQSQASKENESELKASDVILCQHCKRTKNNGIRCIGICVADNDY